ncbi:MAG: hypothetical protein P1P82_17805, partial [Bacteroidales bacterium]|nr:hypothetical protein [Bacteroidales bacterium]
MKVFRIPLFFGLMLLITSCNQEIRIVHGDLEIIFDKELNTKVNDLSPDAAQLSNDFTATEYIVTKRFPAEQFTRTFYAVGNIENESGKG